MSSRASMESSPSPSPKRGASLSISSGVMSSASESSDMLASLPVEIRGIHVHLRSQNLSCEILGQYYENCFHLALRVKELLGCRMDYINFGGGVGIVYDEARETPLDIETLRGYAEHVAAENARTLGARLMIESGRFLTCQMGTYYLKVVDKKAEL